MCVSWDFSTWTSFFRLRSSTTSFLSLTASEVTSWWVFEGLFDLSLALWSSSTLWMFSLVLRLSGAVSSFLLYEWVKEASFWMVLSTSLILFSVETVSKILPELSSELSFLISLWFSFFSSGRGRVGFFSFVYESFGFSCKSSLIVSFLAASRRLYFWVC